MKDQSMPKIIVARCCKPGNPMGCTLWRVSDEQGTGLGRFGTKTGALDFAHGRIESRNRVAIRELVRTGEYDEYSTLCGETVGGEVTLETILEVEE